jgi:hypothetical protein
MDGAQVGGWRKLTTFLHDVKLDDCASFGCGNALGNPLVLGRESLVIGHVTRVVGVLISFVIDIRLARAKTFGKIEKIGRIHGTNSSDLQII